MKKIILAMAIIFSLNIQSQSKPTTPPNDKVVKKALYTPKEKETARKNFLKEVDKIGMSPSVKTKYLAIVDKHTSRLKDANKDRKLTQSQATTNVNKIIKEQNQEIKNILTPDQYKQHKLIINRYQNSINYRIQNQ